MKGSKGQFYYYDNDDNIVLCRLEEWEDDRWKIQTWEPQWGSSDIGYTTILDENLNKWKLLPQEEGKRLAIKWKLKR
jgi:hypothetical protein